jgi:hypothetical protein
MDDIKIEVDKLYQSDILDEEKESIRRLVDSLIYYKRVIPISLKTDIKLIIEMTNRIKKEQKEQEKSSENCKCKKDKVQVTIDENEELEYYQNENSSLIY